MSARIAQDISLQDARMNASRNRASYRWPSGAGADRLQPAYDPALRQRFALTPGAKLFTIGSCF
jgi:hypothetical protein